MNDTWINWRFGVRHLQIGKWFVRFDVNMHHVRFKPSKWFEIYD